MKTKKTHKNDTHHAPKSSTPSKAPAITNRRSDKCNKQNLIQITQPLDGNIHTYPSKQFILSRQSFNNTSKNVLRDISSSKNINRAKVQPSKGYQPQKSNSFDRRLSLKCTGNYSQQLDYQKSQRLSMAPLRRQSLGQTIAPQSMMDERESMSSMYQNSLLSNDSKSKLTIKKEAIMTNLMNKLDHEQDLRSIIQLKLKNGSNVSNISNMQKKNCSYITDFNQQPQNHMMASKLQQCQNEIIYFKSVIRQMSQKIVQLTEDRTFKRKSNKKQSPFKQSAKNNQDDDILSLIRKISVNGQKNEIKQSKTIGTQVDPSHFKQSMKKRESFHEKCDFFDHLEKTIKVLDGAS